MHIRNCPETYIKAHCFRYENPLGFRYNRIGSNTLSNPCKSFDFTRFRLYYGSSKLGARETKPRFVAKGVCDEAEGVVEDLSIFRRFWLP